MGLELFISWQAVVLAVLTSVLFEAFKRVLDMTWKKRKQNRWMTRLGMPALHGALGFGVGVASPLRPEALMEYVSVHVTMPWLGYGVWGVLVGGVAGHYLYRHFKAFLSHNTEEESLPSEPPAPA
jgi:hypothetical protein